MASQSEFDTFDYLKPADYLPSLQQRYSEQNQGFEDAEQVAKMNDRQRVANAEIMGKVIKNAESFSKSAAKVFKQERDKAQNAYKNIAFGTQQEIGASQEDMAKWRRNREALGEDHSVAQYLAFKATEAGNSELAGDLQNLTGWRVQIQEETLAKRWANNYEPTFYDPEKGIRSRDENGNYNYFITLKGDNGEDRIVHWDNAKQSEKLQLINHYNEQTGFNEVSHYRKEFATDTFWQKHWQNIDKILQKENSNALEQQKFERLETTKSTLIEAAKYGNGNFAKTLLELELNETAWLGEGRDRATARTALMELVKQMIMDGDIDASEATLDDFTFFHNGENAEKGLDFFKEYHGWGDMVRDALIAKKQEHQKDIQGFNINFVDTSKNYLEENNLPLNEQTLSQTVEQYKQAYYAKFGEFPTTVPPDLLNMVTIEDKEDRDVDSILEGKKARGEEITYSDYSSIQDTKLRKKWHDYAQSAAGQGLTEIAKKHKEDYVNPLVQTKLNTALGHYDHKNMEHKQMMARANARYNVLYSSLKDSYPPEKHADLHAEVLKRLGIDIDGWMTEPPPPPTKKTWLQDLHKGKTSLKTARDEGTSYKDTLSTKLLDGSETYYKDLERYAKDPTNSKIPSYYHEIASDLKLTPWEVANLQYRSQTGKDLPKPGHQTHIESLSPLVRYWMTTHPNGKKALRGYVIESKSDINDESFITPGIIPIGAVG